MKLRDPELNKQLKDAVNEYEGWPEWMKSSDASAESTEDSVEVRNCLAAAD